MMLSQLIAGVWEPAAPVRDTYAEAVRVWTQRALGESASVSGRLADPLDALRDPLTGELWNQLGIVDDDSHAPAKTETELKEHRSQCRVLAERNEFAINGHENRINYIVGTGHKYTVEPKRADTVSDDSIEAAQAVVNDFLRVNKWHKRQQEIVKRMDRDGECFLRLFADPIGGVRVRFIEPGQVSKPRDERRPEASWGILTDPEDVETVLGYWVDGEFIDAAEIQHRKRGVDLNVKRGDPLFRPVLPNLRRAEKLLRNMSVVATSQAAIAIIRKHQTATSSQVSQFVSNAADYSVTDTGTNQTYYMRGYQPGTIIDANANTEYEFPSQGIDATRFIAILQAELRAVASRLVMPEFMLTSDASNANYSSTLVAEGPAVKQFQRLQWDMIEDDLAIMQVVVRAAEMAGRLPLGTTDLIEVQAEPPRIAVRDRAMETTADMALVDHRVMSRKTAATRQDLDWDAENEQIAEEREASDPFGGMENNPLFNPAARQDSNQDDDNADDQDE